MTNTKQQLFDKLTETLGKEKLNQGFEKTIFNNRKKVRELLSQNISIKNIFYSENHTDRFSFLSEYREFLGLPKFIDLDLFNALNEVIITSGKDINYDDLLKKVKKSKAKSIISNNKYAGPNVDKKIKNQGEYISQGLVELVSNAIDAQSTHESIGRFGEGFYQSLKFLTGDSELLVKTKKDKNKAFQVSLKNLNGKNIIGTVGIDKTENGTTIELKKSLSIEEQNLLKEFLIKSFKTNKRSKIILNGTQINILDDYNYLNGIGLTKPTQEVIVKVNENGFKVIDKGVGMSSQDLAQKLLYPNETSKKRKNSESMSYEDIKKLTQKETAFFYKHFLEGQNYKNEFNETKKQKTNIRLQVGGVLIEDFSDYTSFDISEFCLELPSFTWLPKSRNEIQLTKEVVISLQLAISKISEKIKDPKEKIMILEIIGKIIKHLKQRESSNVSTKKEYDISLLAKKEFLKIKIDLEKAGITTISSIKGLQEIVPESDDIVFIDEEFLNFDLESIPNIKRLKNISDQKIPFYELEFSNKAPYDYLILKNCVIVNSKYTKNQSDLAKINTQVNLNTGYEQGSDIVFYGIIKDNYTESTDEKLKSNETKRKDEYKFFADSFVDSFAEVKKEDINQGNILQIDNEKILKYKVLNEQLIKLKNDFLNHTNIGFIDFFLKMSEKNQDLDGFFDKTDNELLFIFAIFYGNNNNTFICTSEIKDFSQDFIDKFASFFRENSTNITELIKEVILKLYKVKNFEKYILQIMTLVNDAKNAKYIKEYINGLINIDKEDLIKLFDYFENDKDKSDNESENQEIDIEKKYGVSKGFYNLLNTFKSRGLKIQDIYIKKEINGVFMGILVIDGKQYLFKGDKIIDEIGGIKLKDSDSFVSYFTSDGISFGKILLGNICYIFHGDDIKSIENLDFKKEIYEKFILDEDEISTNATSSISGKNNIKPLPNGEFLLTINIKGKNKYFYGSDFKPINYKIGGKKIGPITFGGYDIDDCYDISILLDGKPFGKIKIKDKIFYFHGDKIIKDIGGVEFNYISEFNIGINGKPFGIVSINNKKYPFVGNKIIKDIGGEDFVNTIKFNVGPDLKPFGIIYKDNRRIAFYGDKVIKDILGIEFDNVSEFNIGLDGKPFGIILINGTFYPFYGDKIIKDIGGIELCSIYKFNIGLDGKYFGIILINGTFYPFYGDKIIKDIGGIEFTNVKYFNISIYGTPFGKVEIKGKNYPFYGDKVIKDIGGIKIDDIDDIEEFNIGTDGKPFGIVKIKGQKFNFYGNIIIKDFFQESIEKKYKGKVSSFVEFLSKGGEFLNESENQVNFESDKNMLLTDVIGISRNFSDEIESLKLGNEVDLLEVLKKEIKNKLKNRNPFERNITSTIDGQDRSSMIWLREVIQNSRDSILKAKRNGLKREYIDKVNIDFYSNDQKWISRIIDNIGMSPYEVFKYLLTPGKSGKENETGATGMFGQGFYALTIGASEVKLKTSNGDGKTTYIKLVPKYNENKDIIDFDINYDIKQEYFIGTVIERIDENEGISGNIGALIGLGNIQKYVGNVLDIDINYNCEPAFKAESLKILETELVPGLGTLSLKQNKDKQERLTKDNLFISEIKDEYIDFLPDFMIDYIKKNGYSIDLPALIGLTDTRNSITNFEENIELLKPYIFNLFCRQIIKDYLAGKTTLPMMPLDYYGLDLYERKFDKEVIKIAEKSNNSKVLSSEEIYKLVDKEFMIQYLINLQFQNAGEKISIRQLKQNRDNEEKLKKHTNNVYAINHNADSLNTSMDVSINTLLGGTLAGLDFLKGLANRVKEDISKDKEKQDFVNKITLSFLPLTKRLFGCEIEFGIYKRKDKDELRAVDYGFDKNGNIFFNFNLSFFEKFKNYDNYKMIELITHEFTHLIEDLIKSGVDFEGEIVNGGKNLKEVIGDIKNFKSTGFGTHEKDLEHEHSFERIQRQILKMMTRENL